MNLNEHTQNDTRTKKSIEEQEHILKERAISLSKDLSDQNRELEYIEVTEFVLAGERYAIETSFVDEVHPFNDYTTIPCTPSYIFGIMNIRGKIVSVIDFKVFFDLPDPDIVDSNKAIIVHNETMEFGILADQILGVKKVMIDSIQTSIPTLTGIHLDFLKGVTNDRLVILDGNKLLENKNLIVHDEV
jgi:purine-binding chemotaxis protein CheW